MKTENRTVVQRMLIGAIVLAVITLFVLVAVFYMNNATSPSDDVQHAVTQAPSSQESGNRSAQRVVLNQDGETIHVGDCPFGEEVCAATEAVTQQVYRARVQTVTDRAVTVKVTDGDNEGKTFVIQKTSQVVPQKVDAGENRAQEIAWTDIGKGKDVTIVVGDDGVTGIYIVDGFIN